MDKKDRNGQIRPDQESLNGQNKSVEKVQNSQNNGHQIGLNGQNTLSEKDQR